jgi:23S rRNA (cytosine1962-C5)-methyltransferase
MADSAPLAAPVVVTRRGAARWEGGHPWIYRSDVARHPERSGFARVEDERGRALGWAAVNPRSEITVRFLHRHEQSVDEEVLRTLLDRALAHRDALVRTPEWGLASEAGMRLVHADADALPGLVVDRYDDVLVLGSASAAFEPFLPVIVAHLVDRTGVRGVLGRLDVAARAREGLAQEVRLLHGEVSERVWFRSGAASLVAEPWEGQKTGAFLDQRVNARRLAAYARGRGLDAFAYHGGFGLPLALGADGEGGVDELELLDASERALRTAAEVFERNGARPPSLHVGDAFARLRELDAEVRRGGSGFDVVSLDPPALAKRRRDLDRAYAGYKELNLRALRILAPGGVLGTSSCSFHVSDDDFLTMLEDAAADAGRRCRVLGRFGAAADHPERLGFPESRYLTFVLLQADD